METLPGIVAVTLTGDIRHWARLMLPRLVSYSDWENLGHAVNLVLLLSRAPFESFEQPIRPMSVVIMRRTVPFVGTCRLAAE